MPWTRLGAGTFNNAFRSDDGRSVLKIQKDARDQTDRPERSVRIWNDINRHIPPPATLAHTEHGDGWICPFIEGRQSTDTEMSGALLDIFTHSSGRIVVDATAPKNFVTRMASGSSTGQVICVDIGMALQMERNEEDYFSVARQKRSDVSLETWRAVNHAYDDFFAKSRATYPETVDTIKALLYIKSNRPDLSDVTFLKTNPRLIQTLARGYDADSAAVRRALDTAAPRAYTAPMPPVVHAVVEVDPATLTIVGAPSPSPRGLGGDETSLAAAKKMLEREKPFSLESTKESCIRELERYINSRGRINHEGVFEPSLRTKLFRNDVLTAHKVQTAMALIREIREADTIVELKMTLRSTQGDEFLAKAKLASGFIASVGRCMLSIAATEKNLEDKLEHSPD